MCIRDSAGTVSVTPVTAPQITLPELNFEIERPDLSGLAAMQQKMSDIKSQYSDLQKTVAALMPQLETMQKQMQTITDNKAVVEQNLGAMQKLTAGVAQLDAGDVYKRQLTKSILANIFFCLRPSISTARKKEAALSTGSILSLVSPPHRSSLLLTRPPDRFWMSFMLHRHPPTALRTRCV